MSATIDELVKAEVEAATAPLRAELQDLRDRLENREAWPALVTLKDFCDRTGLNYASMRHRQYRSALPNEGYPDLVIGTRRYWRRGTVLGWLEGGK